MYYIIRNPIITNDNGEALVKIHNDEFIGDVWTWQGGELFPDDEADSIPKPIELQFERYRGYSGPIYDYFDSGVAFMSKKLKEALESFGVDNVDFYDLVFREKSTGEEIACFAFNIVGLVAMADLDKSSYSSFDGDALGDTSFEHLEVLEENAKGMYLFRMAENTNAVFFHEKLKNYIEKEAGIDSLLFLEPSEWMQL